MEDISRSIGIGVTVMKISANAEANDILYWEFYDFKDFIESTILSNFDNNVYVKCFRVDNDGDIVLYCYRQDDDHSFGVKYMFMDSKIPKDQLTSIIFDMNEESYEIFKNYLVLELF